MAPTITAAMGPSQEHLSLSHKVNPVSCFCSRFYPASAVLVTFMCKTNGLTDRLVVFAAEKTCGGETAQGEDQQQHRAAQVSPVCRVPPTAARLQAGESRRPGDGCHFPHTSAAAEEDALCVPEPNEEP